MIVFRSHVMILEHDTVVAQVPTSVKIQTRFKKKKIILWNIVRKKKTNILIRNARNLGTKHLLVRIMHTLNIRSVRACPKRAFPFGGSCVQLERI